MKTIGYIYAVITQVFSRAITPEEALELIRKALG